MRNSSYQLTAQKFVSLYTARRESEEDSEWRRWKSDYRQWIQALQRDPEGARGRPDLPILRSYGLVNRFVDLLEKRAAEEWEIRGKEETEGLADEETEALKAGLQKGVRDRMLTDIEEETRLAAIELSHEIPFPALQLSQAVKSLESITGLLALNMKDDAALEGFFLQSLRIWTM